jgi:ribonuclease BN (tRNA processing enzyme)
VFAVEGTAHVNVWKSRLAEPGAIAREAGVRRIEAFHFSSRYVGEETRLLNEVQAAFEGECSQRGGS